uniref:Uncharacterized protein n=1 Tax=Plectus sambesii TaxID=2011161 RepID=A0A914W0B7_9BILA
MSTLALFNDKTEPMCLCGWLRVTTGTLCITIAEVLILCHSLIFTFTNYTAGADKYAHFNPVFSPVVKFEYLLPFLIIQIAWLATGLLQLIGIKAPLPYMIVPHLIVLLVGIVGGAAIFGAALYNIEKLNTEINWQLTLALSICIAVVSIEVYFIWVKWLCFRHLIRKKQTVAAEQMYLAAAVKLQPPNWDSRVSSAVSYSRRSTMPITDAVRIKDQSAIIAPP